MGLGLLNLLSWHLGTASTIVTDAVTVVLKEPSLMREMTPDGFLRHSGQREQTWMTCTRSD